MSFNHLPVRYTCEDLRRKVADILEHLGVREGAVVQPRRCERALGSAARSPRLRLQFELLSAVAEVKAAAKLRADVIARRQEVRIAPGEPANVKDSDCDLLRQLRPHLPLKPVSYRLNCRAGPVLSSARFVLVFRPLFAEPGPTRVAAAVGRSVSR